MLVKEYPFFRACVFHISCVFFFVAVQLCSLCSASVRMYSYLVGVVEEVHRHAERQGVMIGVSEQDGQDLHPGRPGLPLTLLLSAFHGALAVDGILPHLSPEYHTTQSWHSAAVIQLTPDPQPQPGAIGQQAGINPGQQT